MKNVFYLLLIGILFSISSCKPPAPGSHTPRETTLVLATNFLMVNSHHDGAQGIKNLNVDVFVDRYAGNGQIEANYKNYSFAMTNDDFTYSNRSFEIEVPEDGTYGVTVMVQSAVCFDNASSEFCNWNKGRIRYRGVSTIYNSANGIPTSIPVNPTFINSF